MKNTLLKIAAAAGGITLAICLIAGCVFWYASRPRSWDTNGLRAKSAKAEPITKLDDKLNDVSTGVFFTVDVENTTASDHTLRDKLAVMQETKDSHALHGSFLKLDRSYFLPAHHIVAVSLTADDLCAAHVDPQSCFDRYFASEQAIVLFDKEDRYELRIPVPTLTLPASK